MQSRDPREYTVRIQHSLYKDYTEDGLVGTEEDPQNKTFWLIHNKGNFNRRYSTESAPEWVLQIYNKIMRNK